MIQKSRNAPPRSGAMVEALRGLGYSTPTALADIIDNSIAANANRVDIAFTWDGRNSKICLVDNGKGMDDQGLELAMRLGQKNPLDDRDVDDLGRFGLGLKTASFSQCRRLTVASKKDYFISCLRWDLDVLASNLNGEWILLEGPANGSEHLLEALNSLNTGTIVILENLDRIVTPHFLKQDFLDLVDKVENHLRMVFHRFIDGIKPKLIIVINGQAIKAWDPFLTDNPATWSSPLETINFENGNVKTQCFVLPHKDRLDPATHDSAGGPHGWTAQQGFYVYRNKRLLVAGGWLGLGRGRSWTKEEPHRLARIRLDIPNTADGLWEIDVRKSKARPPVAIRDRLTRIAIDTRERARRVFAHRGQAIRTTGGAQVDEVWRVDHFNGGIRYRIDKNHPAVKSLFDDFAGTPKEADFMTMLRIIEETIPVQRIWLDTAEAKETPRTGFAGDLPSEITAIAMIMFKNMVKRKGFSTELAKAQLLKTEPFNKYPELVNSLPDIESIED